MGVMDIKNTPKGTDFEVMVEIANSNVGENQRGPCIHEYFQ